MDGQSKHSRRQLLKVGATALAAVPQVGMPCTAFATQNAAARAARKFQGLPADEIAVDVRRYGAVGDGRSDDTRAIQSAIDVLNDWTTGVEIGRADGGSPDLARGGTVRIPAGVYRVTRPILLAPGIRLQGSCPVNQVGTNFAQPRLSIIRADFPAGSNWYVIDTGNWRQRAERTGIPIEPYRVIDAVDQFYRGNDKDNAYGTWLPNFAITSVLIDGNHSAFGGIRAQLSSNFRIGDFCIRNTQFAGLTTSACYEFAIGSGNIQAPIPWHIIGCESALQSAGELWLSAEPSRSWLPANESLIESVFYPFGDQIGSWYGLARKCILAQWCVNATFGCLFIARGNVGIEAYKANISILHMENEFTESVGFLCRASSTIVVDSLKSKIACPLATGDGTKIVIREPHALSSRTSFTPLHGESSSDLELHIHNAHPQPDGIIGTSTRFSTVNKTRLYPYAGPVSIWVDDALGDISNDGLKPTAPTTLDGALRWINHQPHVREFAVLVKDEGVHTISEDHSLTGGVHVRFQRDLSGTTPAVMTLRKPLRVSGASIALNGVTLSRYNPPAAFAVSGVVHVEITSARVEIPNSCALFEAAPGSSARISATGWQPRLIFGTGAGLCAGGRDGFVGYDDTFASASAINPVLEALTSGKVRKIASNLF